MNMKARAPRYWFFMVVLILLQQSLKGQDTLPPLRDTTVWTAPGREVRFFDEPVMPVDFSIRTPQGEPVSPNRYRADFNRAVLVRTDSAGSPEFWMIRFRPFPRSWVYPKGPLVHTKGPPPDEFDSFSPSLPSSGLRADGFLERGILAGNRTDAGALAKMDIRLSGELSPGVRVEGRIYDDNAPFGYDGITTTFKDLNRAFIRIQGPGWTVSAGDSAWHFRSPLLAFDRQNKGIGIEGGKRVTAAFHAAAMKGLFARNVFRLVKGNYGPYPLTASDTRWIYVIRGSEKVYLNGRLLQPDRDYRMNYETAELMLDPSLDFDTHDVLSVRFRYANRHYARWTSFQQTEFSGAGGRWKFFHYNESDIKTKPLLFVLDSATVEALRRASDSVPRVLYAIPTEFSPDKILYRKNSLPGGDFYFEFADAPAGDTLYEVKFFYAGKGAGEYRLDRYLAAGPVYVYTGPGGGDYTPRFTPPLPSDNHYAGVGWQGSLGPWKAEWQGTVRIYNPNTFIPRQYAPHGAGYASFLYMPDSSRGWWASGQWRYMAPEYQTPDPVYDPEFLNAWPTDGRVFSANHRLLALKTGYRHRNGRFTLESGHLRLPGGALWRWTESHDWQRGKWKWTALHRLTGGMQNGTVVRRSDWKHRISSAYNKFNSGIELEGRSETGYPRDTSGYRFSGGRIFLAFSGDTARSVEGGISYRLTDSLHTGRFAPASRERAFYIRLKVRKSRSHHRLKLEWLTDPLVPARRGWTLAWDGQARNASRSLELTWQAGTYGSMSRKYEVVYTRVPDGQGQFQWVDYNQNGIPEQDEFEPAYYTDRANYIRTVLPTRFYEPARTLTWTLSFRWDPSRSSSSAGFIRKWQWQFHAGINNRTGTDVPWVEGLRLGPATAEGRTEFAQQIRFKPGEKWTILYRTRFYDNLMQIYDGPRRHTGRTHRMEFVRQTNVWKIAPYAESRFTSFRSEDYPLKNYATDTRSWGIPVEWKTGRTGWEAGWKHGTARGEENFLLQKEIYAGVRIYSSKLKGFINFRLISNSFRGEPLSPAGFAMLEGLTPGVNRVGRAGWEWQMKGNLFLDFQYEYRQSEHAPAIHTGKLVVRARF
ncbi:MAG: hypothetical protein GXO27_03310 [Chlorobi bacterium]|nr:hypothetical protein [Chlorobiota bacterium]